MNALDLIFEKYLIALKHFKVDELQARLAQEKTFYNVFTTGGVFGSSIKLLPTEKLISMYERRINSLVATDARKKELLRQVKALGEDDFNWYFITVGYDDSNINEEKIRNYSQKVANSTYFSEVEYVNEKYRKNDDGEIYIHHHTHFLVKSDLPKSRVVDRVFGTVKKVVASKNFVDVKTKRDNVGTYADKLKYIKGDKTQSKLECVALDRQWRLENNL